VRWCAPARAGCRRRAPAFGRPDPTCPNDFALLPPHTEGGRPFISLLAGHRELERPDWTAAELIKAQAPDEAAFAARKAAYHLY
jgi:hypothetical protein